MGGSKSNASVGAGGGGAATAPAGPRRSTFEAVLWDERNEASMEEGLAAMGLTISPTSLRLYEGSEATVYLESDWEFSDLSRAKGWSTRRGPYSGDPADGPAGWYTASKKTTLSNGDIVSVKAEYRIDKDRRVLTAPGVDVKVKRTDGTSPRRSQYDAASGRWVRSNYESVWGVNPTQSREG